MNDSQKVKADSPLMNDAQITKAESALMNDVQNVKADPALTNDGHQSIWTNTYRESSQKCGFDLTNSNVN